jgi:hypothetical protein
MKEKPLFERGKKKSTPGYNSWRGMLQRCSDPKLEFFRYYGARGIQVCERWRSFENFISDLGPRPSMRYSLERPNGSDYRAGQRDLGHLGYASFNPCRRRSFRLEPSRQEKRCHQENRPGASWPALLGALITAQYYRKTLIVRVLRKVFKCAVDKLAQTFSALRF